MPNYVLDSSATQVNTAINNVVNAQGTPTNGSSLMVTSDGIYQALNNIQHTNFNTGTLVTSTDTIASNKSDTQIPTTQAVDEYIDQKISTKFGLSIGNFSDAYQNTSVNGDTFFKSTHFNAQGGFSGQYSDFTETSVGSGQWQVGTSGYYLIHARGDFNDTSSTGHNINLYVNNVLLQRIFHTQNSVTFPTFYASASLSSGDVIKLNHNLTYGGGGVFRYRNAQLDILKLF
jgi:hypothetical protein